MNELLKRKLARAIWRAFWLGLLISMIILLIEFEPLRIIVAPYILAILVIHFALFFVLFLTFTIGWIFENNDRIKQLESENTNNGD